MSNTPLPRVSPPGPQPDARGLVDAPKPKSDQSDEVVMRQLRELTEQIDALSTQYPKIGKNAQVAKRALMAMMRDILASPTQPAEAPAQRFG